MEIIEASSLFVSEPNPYMFGNPNNKVNKYWTNNNWLKSRFHFSFAEYRDRNRSGFDSMLVMNDDLVQPERGFGTHPHSNMEIVTYVVNGELTHRDSTGNQESLGRGSIQFMSAGKGLMHSESNEHTTDPCRFIQMWFLPRTNGLDVRYGSFDGIVGNAQEKRRNKWFHMVSDISKGFETPVKLHQDVNLFVAELDSGNTLEFEVKHGRSLYALVIETVDGDTIIGGKKLKQHSAIKISQPGSIPFISPTKGRSHILIVDQKRQ